MSGAGSSAWDTVADVGAPPKGCWGGLYVCGLSRKRSLNPNGKLWAYCDLHATSKMVSRGSAGTGASPCVRTLCSSILGVCQTGVLIFFSPVSQRTSSNSSDSHATVSCGHIGTEPIQSRRSLQCKDRRERWDSQINYKAQSVLIGTKEKEMCYTWMKGPPNAAESHSNALESSTSANQTVKSIETDTVKRIELKNFTLIESARRSLLSSQDEDRLMCLDNDKNPAPYEDEKSF
ncbi:hypothetical protein Tco_0555850 [Tanacetum coccineum]